MPFRSHCIIFRRCHTPQHRSPSSSNLDSGGPHCWSDDLVADKQPSYQDSYWSYLNELQRNYPTFPTDSDSVPHQRHNNSDNRSKYNQNSSSSSSSSSSIFMSSSLPSLKQQWSSLLSATLETCIHHILYIRRVYPRDSFVKTRFLGISCRANRHAQVVSYISNTLNSLVPAIVSGKANEVYMVIFRDETIVLERHVLSIFNFPIVEEESHDATVAVMKDLEQAMRNVILRIHSLEARDMGKLHGDSLCFKLAMHLVKSAANTKCNELETAVSQGKWFHPGDMENDMECELRRPLQRISVPTCGLEMELRMHVPLG